MSFIQKGLKWIAEMQPATAQKTVLAMAQPRLGSVGGITSKWFLPGLDGKQEWLTLSQRMCRADTDSTPDCPLGPCTGAEGRAGRQGTVPWPSAHKNSYISDSERVPGATQRHLWVFNHLHQHRESPGLALNEWVAQDWKGHWPRKPGGTERADADVYIVESQQSISLLCHNSHIRP